jgi:hypothetical protein
MGFKVTDFIADTGGLLVALGGDRLVEVGAEFFEPLVEDLLGHEALGNLAGVSGSLV